MTYSQKKAALMKFLLFIFILMNSTFGFASQGIWPNIPFTAGADYCNLPGDLNRDRTEARRDYIYETLPLMHYGASTYEAYQLIYAFEKLYEENRIQAQQKLQVSLEAMLKSELSRFYNYFQPKERKLIFRNSVIVQNLIAEAKARKEKGLESNSDLHAIPEINYMAVGTFSMSASCDGKIEVTLDFVQLSSGEIQSFYGGGTPHQAINSITAQLFDFFQRTRFPSSITVTDGSKLTILGTPTGRLTDKTDWKTANRACSSMKARLPNSQEVKDVSLYGDYSGGISLQKHANYCLQGEDNVFVSDFVGQEEQSFRLINDKTAFFFCVK
jgi:hypothetical protein